LYCCSYVRTSKSEDFNVTKSCLFDQFPAL